MTKTKIFNFLLIVVCLFSLTSCAKKINKFEEFKEAMNKEYDSVTYKMEMVMELKMGSESERETTDITVKTDGTKTLFEGKLYGDEGKAYAELEGDKYKAWTYDDGAWEADDYISKEQYESSISYPTIEVEEGDFEYKNGVWVANIDKIKEKLKAAVTDELKKILGSVGISYTIDIDKYTIKFDKDNIDEIELDFSIIMSQSGRTIEFNFSYTIKFSDHNNTKVERPEGLPEIK